MNNNNKKRIFIAVIFLLLLFLLMTFAGGNTEVAVVEFIDGFDNSVIDTQQVEIGEDAEVPEDPKHKNYVFAGWFLFSDHDVKVTDFTKIEEDLKVIALYAGDRNNNGIDDEKEEKLKVTFIDGFNNEVIKTEEVLEGMDATAPEVPTHRGYTFIGWDKGYTNITADTNVTAQYNRNENPIVTYTVTFVDGETNEVIATQNVREGNTATLPEAPVHENRVFVEWVGEYTNVNSNRTITATYADDKNNNGTEDETEPHYDITYVDYNDEVLEVIEDVLVDTLTPTIEDPERENYKFTGWNPEVSEYVTDNATYKAEYNPINDENNNEKADEEEEHYTIIYNDYDGKEIKKFENVLVDTNTPKIEEPTREYYTFNGWNPEVSELVKGDATYTATYKINNDVDDDKIPDETENKYTVNYYLISEEDEETYKTFTDLVDGIKTPIVENPTRENYEFVTWEPTVSETVTKNQNYVAVWDAINDKDEDNIADEEEFKIEFIVDQKVVKTEYLIEGEMPTAPTVTDTDEDNRVFTGWNKQIVAAVEDTQYIAIFKEDLDNDGTADENQYKVQFVIDGEVMDTQYLDEDEMPQVPIVPQEIYPEKKVFDKWTPEIVPNYEGQYIGTWTDDINEDKIADKDQFLIEFYNKGELVHTNYYNLNDTVIAPTLLDTNNDNEVHTGWTPEFNNKATSAVKYNAVWEADLNNNGEADKEETKYTVKYLNKDGSVFKEYVNQLKGLATPQPENNPTAEGYVFNGWDGVKPTITANAEYASKWLVDSDKDGIADETEVKVEFVVDGKVVKTEYLVEGEMPTAPSMTEYDKEDDERVFTGWNPEIRKVEKSDETLRFEGKFEADLNNNGEADKDETKYTVKYLNKDGSVFKEYTNQLKGLSTPTPETNPTAKGFVFNGWENVSSTITGNAEYASKWLVDSDEDGIADEEEFKIEFIVDNKVVKTEYLTEGQNPTAPTVKDTNTDNRVFKGWNPKVAPATEDARYTAQFAEDTNNDGVADSEQFLIEFYNENELVSSNYYSKNATVTAPVLTDTDKDNKVHTGWTPEFNATATAAVKYNAVWKDDIDNDGIADESEKKWTVNYYLISENDETAYKTFTDLVDGQTTPTVSNPTREYYTFSGWNPSVAATVTENKNYVAVWTAINDEDNDNIADEEEFKIEFIVDNKVVKTEYLTEGQNPTAPTVKDTNTDNRVFKGWNPKVAPATEDARYTAQFAEDIDNDGIADSEQLLVQFVANNQTILSDYVTKGQPTPMPAPNKIPTVAGKAFYAWNPEVTDTVEENVTYVALYGDDTDNDGKADITENKIEFKIDNVLVDTQYLDLNEMPVAPTPSKEGYVLSTWTPAIDKVTGPQVYNATWLVDSNKDGYADEEQFLIEFYNKGQLVTSNYYNEGATVVAPTLTDTKEDGETHTGWTPKFNATATAAVKYNAVWETDTDNDNIADEEEFKIEFIVDNKVVKTEYLTEGQNPTAPIVKDTNTDNRVFKGWNPKVAPATEDARYTAQFAEDTNNDGVADSEQFLIEFYNENELVSSDYYSKNATVTAPVLTDTDKDNKVHTGWTPEFNATATAAVKYNAVWKDDVDNDGYADEEQHKVEFVVEGTIISTQYLNKDEMPEVPTVSKELYPENKVFDGWTPEISANYEGQYTATWTDDLNGDGIADKDQTLWTVKFYAKDNTTIISEQIVVDGESAIAPTAPTVSGFEFVKWIQDYTEVRTNLNVYPEYKDIEAPVVSSTVTPYQEKDGEYYRAEITFTVTDNVAVNEVRYAEGKQNSSNYDKATIITEYVITDIKKNGIYTIFAKDEAGNLTTHYVEVDSISLNEGVFEDLFAQYELGVRTNGYIDGNEKYSQRVTINPLDGITIVDARIYVDHGAYNTGFFNSYASMKDFTSNVDANGKSTFGKELSYEGNKIDYTMESRVTSRFTIYVKYSYQVEVRPGVYETRYETKLYKIRLAKYLQQ